MIEKILFFPFTHMTEGQLEAVSSVFSKVDCLAIETESVKRRDRDTNQALSKTNLYDNETIVPFFPSDQDLEKVNQAAAQYLNWAQMHKGNEKNLKALLQESPYFTDDTHITSIKTQLIGGQQQVQGSNEEPLLKALLFLKMAQLSDAQQDNIDAELAEVDKNSKDLVMALRGMDAPLSEETNSPGDSDWGDKMTQERIVCWADVMSQKGLLDNTSDTPILLTTSPSVFDWFETNCDQAINPLDIQNLKVHNRNCVNKNEWQGQLKNCLEKAIEDEDFRKEDLPAVNDDCNAFIRLKLGLFSGTDFNSFFKAPGKQIPVCLVQLK